MVDSNYGSVPTATDEKPTKFHKSSSCNDIFFALLFIGHLAAVIASFVLASNDDEEGEQDETNTMNEKTKFTDKGVVKFVGAVAAVALILSTMTLSFMAIFADELVEIALVVSIACTGAVLGYGIYIWATWMMVVGGLAFLAALWLTCSVWKKIPFAAANLKTAIRAVQTNFGLIFVAYTLEVVALGWTILWIAAAGSNMDRYGSWIVFLYLLSFFWTQQVINNIQHVIVSSVLGSWWYNPVDANFCWDDGLNQAICRAWTLSFGSICFGSLLASFVQALKWMHRLSARFNENCCGRCIHGMINCLLSCIQDALEYFNKWAFTFVGIHGDSYLASGRSVISLFKQRGWVSIINDALADIVMVVMKVSVSLLSGLMGWWLVNHDDDIFVGIGIPEDKDDVVGFVVGTLIGYILSSIMMELVGSAVSAVIVCFAEAPDVFNQNYKQLSEEMLDAWKKAYPDECADDFSSVKV